MLPASTPNSNTVVLGDETDLEQNEMTVGRLNMMKYDTVTPGMEANTKIRYKDPGSLSNLYPSGNTVSVRFYEHVKSIAPDKAPYFMKAMTL